MGKLKFLRNVGLLSLAFSSSLTLYNKDYLKDQFTRAFPEENKAVNIEPILNAKEYVPEEFYIKLFGSDGFIPVYSYNCKPKDCHPQFEKFTSIDGNYHDTDIYFFALQGISSGHRPRNRKNKVADNHDDSVTWLTAVRKLTNLSPENPRDQDLIRIWISENYKNILADGRSLDPTHITFIKKNNKVVDILYDGVHADEKFDVKIYTSGFYRKKDGAWIPESEKFEQYNITDKKGHLILPATNNQQQMLIVPDYILRDDIESITAGVYTGRGRFSKYGIRIEEIIAEINQLEKNERLILGVPEPYAQMIITPTLDLVVSDITQGKKTQKEKREAIIDTLTKEPYSDTDYNAPPLVTLIAGGQCGATAGQTAAMFYLAGITNFSFVFFNNVDSSHVGIYGPIVKDLSLNPQVGEYDKYWYLETTNGQETILGTFMPRYKVTKFEAKIPQPFDLRPQLQHLKSAKVLTER